MGYQRDLYRVDHPELEPAAVEGAFSQIEDEVAPALRRLTDDGVSYTDLDVAQVLNLVSMLAVRVPAVRNNISRFIESVGERVTALSLREPELYERFLRTQADADIDTSDMPTLQELREGWERGAFTLKANDTYLTIETLRQAAVVYEVLIARKWRVLTFDQLNCGPLVTSDRPVNLYWTQEMPQSPFYGPGFGLPKTEVLFPLDRRHVLLGSWSGESGRGLMKREGVGYTNGRTVLTADRHVYAPSSVFITLDRDGHQVRPEQFLSGLEGRTVEGGESGRVE